MKTRVVTKRQDSFGLTDIGNICLQNIADLIKRIQSIYKMFNRSLKNNIIKHI